MATGAGKQPTFRTARAQRGHSARCAPLGHNGRAPSFTGCATVGSVLGCIAHLSDPRPNADVPEQKGPEDGPHAGLHDTRVGQVIPIHPLPQQVPPVRVTTHGSLGVLPRQLQDREHVHQDAAGGPAAPRESLNGTVGERRAGCTDLFPLPLIICLLPQIPGHASCVVCARNSCSPAAWSVVWHQQRVP